MLLKKIKKIKKYFRLYFIHIILVTLRVRFLETLMDSFVIRASIL